MNRRTIASPFLRIEIITQYGLFAILLDGNPDSVNTAFRIGEIQHEFTGRIETRRDFCGDDRRPPFQTVPEQPACRRYDTNDRENRQVKQEVSEIEFTFH